MEPSAEIHESPSVATRSLSGNKTGERVCGWTWPGASLVRRRGRGCWEGGNSGRDFNLLNHHNLPPLSPL